MDKNKTKKHNYLASIFLDLNIFGDHTDEAIVNYIHNEIKDAFVSTNEIRIHLKKLS